MHKSYSEDQTDSTFRRYDSLKKAVTHSDTICHSESCNELQSYGCPTQQKTSDSPKSRHNVIENKVTLSDNKSINLVKTSKTTSESETTTNGSISLKELEQKNETNPLAPSTPLMPFTVEKKRSIFSLRRRKNSKHQ